jgi:glycosyltransferase involved in cell wall biosynthesis
MKKVLIIAFFMPPCRSAGVQRTLKLSEGLKEHGLQPIILTAKEYAYHEIESSQEIPENLLAHTYRAAALDLHRHLSIKGRYFEWMGAIDRWSSWIPSALIKGIQLIRQNRPDVIWSSTPTPSANIIAYVLSRKFDIPWVADYRDPFSYHHFPTAPLKAKVLKKIDRMTASHARKLVFVSKRIENLYRATFYTVEQEKFLTIENGFDSEKWEKALSITDFSPPFSKNKYTLLYSGILYPNGRDPTPLFSALSLLKSEGIIDSEGFELIFQGSGTAESYMNVMSKLNMADLVKFTDSVTYFESLVSMYQADALLLIQGSPFDLQIPAKVYDYIYTRKPLVAVTPKNSATADILKKYPHHKICSSVEEIVLFIKHILHNREGYNDNIDVSDFSRKTKTEEICMLLKSIASENS